MPSRAVRYDTIYHSIYASLDLRIYRSSTNCNYSEQILNTRTVLLGWNILIVSSGHVWSIYNVYFRFYTLWKTLRNAEKLHQYHDLCLNCSGYYRSGVQVLYHTNITCAIAHGQNAIKIEKHYLNWNKFLNIIILRGIVFIKFEIHCV